jgi:hypothetical protein
MSSFDMKANLESNAQAALTKKTQVDTCGYDTDTPNIAYITINLQNPRSAFADIPITLPFPILFIMLVSCINSQASDSLFMHFNRLGKNYTSSTITLSGDENWIPIQSNAGSTASHRIGWCAKFKKPISNQIYFDIGCESGGGPPTTLTFLVSNDVDFINGFIGE